MKVPGNIEEMARVLDACLFIGASIGCDKHDGSIKIAEYLYHEGYRKQKEGEWIKHEESIWEHRYWCSVCNFYRIGAPTPHCQNCGSKMKGGAE